MKQKLKVSFFKQNRNISIIIVNSSLFDPPNAVAYDHAHLTFIMCPKHIMCTTNQV